MAIVTEVPAVIIISQKVNTQSGQEAWKSVKQYNTTDGTVAYTFPKNELQNDIVYKVEFQTTNLIDIDGNTKGSSCTGELLYTIPACTGTTIIDKPDKPTGSTEIDKHVYVSSRIGAEYPDTARYLRLYFQSDFATTVNLFNKCPTLKIMVDNHTIQPGNAAQSQCTNDVDGHRYCKVTFPNEYTHGEIVSLVTFSDGSINKTVTLNGETVEYNLGESTIILEP